MVASLTAAKSVSTIVPVIKDVKSVGSTVRASNAALTWVAVPSMESN